MGYLPAILSAIETLRTLSLRQFLVAPTAGKFKFALHRPMLIRNMRRLGFDSNLEENYDFSECLDEIGDLEEIPSVTVEADELVLCCTYVVTARTLITPLSALLIVFQCRSLSDSVQLRET